MRIYLSVFILSLGISCQYLSIVAKDQKTSPVHTAQTLQIEHRPEAKPEDLYTYHAEVTETVDGDTFHCVIDLGFGMKIRQRVRLRRLDADEIVSAEGKRAKNVLEKILARDQGKIRIKVSKGDDQYGRYLVDVWVKYKNIDQELLDSGLLTLRPDA